MTATHGVALVEAGRPKKPKVYGWPAKWLAPGKWYTVIIPQSESAKERSIKRSKVWGNSVKCEKCNPAQHKMHS